jgi:glycosyltransferase involved in cell wall biosynthesis
MPRLAVYDVVHAFTHHLNSLLPAVLARWVRPGALTIGDRDDLWADGGLYGDGSQLSGLAGLDFRFHSWTERSMGRWFDAMTVVSDDLSRRVIASGIDPLRVRKVINGCPTDRITPGDQQAARAELGLPADRAIAVFVGVGQYDVDLVFGALLELRKAHPDLPRPLTVFIGPNDEWLRGLAAERGLADEILATGMLTDAQILPYLRAADLGLLPFADKPLNWARFPIKIGDYLAAGLPVLTNDVGEMGRIVRETQSGLATAPDAPSYAAGLATLLADRPGLARYRRAAIEAAQKLGWDAIGGELESFYLELGAGKHRARLKNSGAMNPCAS